MILRFTAEDKNTACKTQLYDDSVFFEWTLKRFIDRHKKKFLLQFEDKEYNQLGWNEGQNLVFIIMKYFILSLS